MSTSTPARFSAGRSAFAWLGGWLLLTGGITAWRWEVVSLPPYEDQSFCWLEANFLADTDFDYYRLRYEENWAAGEPSGARGYMISVIPTVLALGMRHLPSIQSLIVLAHLTTFACGAAIVLLAISLVRPVVGRWGAALVGGAILCTPQFGVQIEMVGMDIPMTLAALAAVRLVVLGRSFFAVGAGLCAFFLKPTGALVVAALAAYLAANAAWSWRQGQPARSRSIARFVVAVLALGVAALVIHWGGSIPVTVGLVNDFRVLQLPLALYTTPELVVVFTIALIASVTWSWPLARALLARQAIGVPPREARLLPLCWIIVLGLLAATTRVLFLPRYLTLIVPFLMIIAGATLLRGRQRPIGVGAFLSLIAFDLANQHGRFLPDLERVYADVFARSVVLHPRSNAFTERSREYLRDQRSIMQAAALLEERYADVPIMAGQSMTRYLTKPRLGYVHRLLRATRAHPFRPALEAFVAAETAGHAEMPPRTPIFIWHGEARAMIPAPQSTDEILYEDAISPPLVVYRQTLPQGVNSLGALEEWYLQHSWDRRWALVRLHERFGLLLSTGRQAEFVVEALQTLEIAPDDYDLRSLTADKLIDLGRIDEAIAQLEIIERAVPRHPGAANCRQRLVALRHVGPGSR